MLGQRPLYDGSREVKCVIISIAILLKDNNQILTDDEIQDGYILSCQSRPSSDEVEINYDEV